MTNSKLHKKKVNNLLEDRILYFVVYSIIILFMIVILYPIVFVVAASFSEGTEVQLGHMYLWPVKPTLEGYRAVFSHKNVLAGYRNTIFYTLGGTLINVVMTVLCAYPLSRKDMPMRGFFMFLFVFTMFFGGGLIPTYLLVNDLGMVNTVWALLIPGAMSVYNMIITRTFFQNIPLELLEASRIDGCSDARYFFSVLLPLSQAVVSVIALYYADLLEGKIGLEFLVKYALIVVSSAPIMCLYPFVQKFFAKGVMLGSVKG